MHGQRNSFQKLMTFSIKTRFINYYKKMLLPKA